MTTVCKLAFLTLLLTPFFLPAQTELSGVINHYATVLDIQEQDCLTRIVLSDTTGFVADQKVVIIQMQGATINESNNASFGEVTEVGSAGLYEINLIDSVGANDLFLPFVLENNYELSGQVQAVSMPNYTSATVDNTLIADPWDGTKGGLLALEVTDTLILNAPLDVSGLGFRGGLSQTNLPNDCSWLFPQNDYTYNLGSWRGAAKGEGIAVIIAGKEAGRGAQANGGGGGNDHNAGGGGGGTYMSVGGQGGNNQEPSTFGCRGLSPGVGGRGIGSVPNRVFLGGGGGAGHANNENGTNGGNGGGIIILQVNTLITNGQMISAEGQTPADGGGDGAGGGGAGGTLLHEVQNMEGMLTLKVNGGNGGLVDNANADRCHGPGGGGGGGHVILVGASTPPNLLVEWNGGVAGLSINSGECADSNNGAMDGSTGGIELVMSLEEGDELHFDIPTAAFNYSLLGMMANFDNQSMGAIGYQWDFGDGSNISTASNPMHTFNNPGTYTVQLTAFNTCTAVTTSQVIEIMNLPAPQAALTADNAIGCTPLVVQFSDQSTGQVTNWQWSFPGGTPALSVDPNPSVSYSTPGNYTVTLNAIGPGGMTTVTETDYVQVFPFPTAEFGYALNGASIECFNSSMDAQGYYWDFGDGSDISTEANPTHTYSQPGMYTVVLVAIGPYCTSLIARDVNVVFVGTKDLAAQEWGLQIYPNPTADVVQITLLPSIKLEEITIFNTAGMLLQNQQIATNQHEANIDLSNRPAGVYFLHLTTDKGKVVRRVVKH